MKSVARQIENNAPSQGQRRAALPKRYQARNFARFLGRCVVIQFGFGCLSATGFFVVEIAFAFGMQSLVLALGPTEHVGVRAPFFIPTANRWVILAFVVGTGLIRSVLSWVNIWIEHSTPAKFARMQRSRMIEWIFTSEQISANRMSELFNERTNHAGTMIRLVQDAAVATIIATFLGATLLYICSPITLVTFTLLALVAFPLRKLSLRVKRASEGVLLDWRRLSSRLNMSVKNLLLLRIYGLEKREQASADQSLNRYVEHLVNHIKANAFSQICPQLTGLILICVIVSTSKTPYGMPGEVLLSYLYLLLRFLQNVSSAISASSGALLYWPQTRDLYFWWRDRERAADRLRSAPQLVTPTPARILQPVGWRLSSVTYQYPESTAPTIKSFSLNVAPGTTCVIVGPSGAGKSTLLNLILGQISPLAGEIEISIDGKNFPLRNCAELLLPAVGYVGPESFITEGTIYDNLSYGLSYTPRPDEVDEALRRAECQFIHKLAYGLNHPVTDQGQGLSAGQKQRLSLIRALLRRPRVLILDEATSNLDADTESKLVDTLAQLRGQMTIIAVTHRKELLRIADQQVRMTIE